MTLLSAVERLWAAANQLRDDGRTLVLTAVEDRPLTRPSKLTDDVAAAATGLDGWIAEVQADAARATAAAGYHGDPGRLVEALDATADGLQRVAQGLLEQFLAEERGAELRAYARSSRELAAWTRSVRQGARRVGTDLWTAQLCLAGCWRELVDPLVAGLAACPDGIAKRRT